MTKYIVWFLILIYILNVADLCLTLYGIGTGKAKEANPIMKVFLKNKIIFVLVKLSVPIYPLYRLWENRVWVKTQIGVYILTGIMAFVVIWNIINIFIIPALIKKHGG